MVLETIYTLKELADLLKVSEQVVTEELRTGQLTGFRVGRQWRIRESSVNAYIHAEELKEYGKSEMTMTAVTEDCGDCPSEEEDCDCSEEFSETKCTVCNRTMGEIRSAVYYTPDIVSDEDCEWIEKIWGVDPCKKEFQVCGQCMAPFELTPAKWLDQKIAAYKKMDFI